MVTFRLEVEDEEHDKSLLIEIFSAVYSGVSWSDLYVMSDGDPSLEEDTPKPLLERPEENVFTPKIATPIFSGSVRLHHKPSDVGETESFLSDAQRNELAFQQLFQNGDGELEEVSVYCIFIL